MFSIASRCFCLVDIFWDEVLESSDSFLHYIPGSPESKGWLHCSGKGFHKEEKASPWSTISWMFLHHALCWSWLEGQAEPTPQSCNWGCPELVLPPSKPLRFLLFCLRRPLTDFFFALLDPQELIWSSLILTCLVYLQELAISAIGTHHIGVEGFFYKKKIMNTSVLFVDSFSNKFLLRVVINISK